MNASADPRRKEKVNRYKPPQNQGQNSSGTSNDDLTPDYMNILGKTVCYKMKLLY